MNGKSSTETIFAEAIEIASPQDRVAYLDRACAADSNLRQEVEKLVVDYFRAGPFLESPAARIAEPTLDRPVLEGPGTQIGPYKLMEQIGEGGMGLVFVAEQHQPVRRKVALKVIKPGMDTRDVIARFEAERQALALMDHPNIARVLDAGATASGRPYFVMELVKGVPITQFCDDNRLTPRERLELFTHVCHAVQHAHQKGIIHRDIKPTNVMVTSHDGRPVVKVIDFGVAKAVGQQLTERTLYTALSQMVGTPLYMSPEQAGMSGLDIDTRTDIYSLGVLLYELLTGTTPFDKERLKQAAYDEMRRIIREEEPQKPSTRISELSRSGEPSRTSGAASPARLAGPTSSLASIAALRHTEPAKLAKLVRGDLDWIVMKALEKDRNRRYETANGFAADVLRYLNDEPVQACPPSAMYRFRKFARRNKAALATATVISAALVTALMVLAVSNTLIRRESQAKEVALGERDRALGTARHQEGLAKQNATHAEEQRGIAERNEKTAKTQTLLARRRFYASQMNLAMQAWRAGEMPRVLELLEGQRPTPDEEDLRGFEWYYLWRLCNGGRRLYLHGHTDAVVSVAFSPTGTTLASASWDGTVRLWDTGTGRELSTLRRHSHGVWQVVFSPDGKTLASGGKSTGTLILWDASTGKPLHTFAGPVDGLAFSPDSKLLAGGVISDTGTHVKIWDVAGGAERATLADAGDVVGLLADGKTLVTRTGGVSANSEVQFWDVESGERRLTIPLPRLHCAVLTRGGTRLATASSATPGAPVAVWDTATGQQLIAFAGQSYVRLALSSDGKRLACGGDDRTVTLWEVETGRRLGQDVHLDPVWGVAFSPDGKMLASSTLGGAIKLWDMTPAEEATTIPSVANASLRFALDGRTLLVGGSGPTKLIDVAAGKEMAVLATSHVMAISADANVLALGGSSASFSRSGLTAISADADQSTIWDVRAEREITTLPLSRPPNSYPGLTLSPDGKLLATFYPWGDDNTVKLWNVATQQPRTLKVDPPESHRHSVLCAEFSPDGKLLAAGFKFQWVAVWDVATGKVKLQFSQQPAMMNVRSLAFSPDNQALAVGTDVGAVTLWEVETGKRLASFKGHTSSVSSLAFSSDAKTLATAGADQTVRLWDVLTGQERSTLAGHKGPVHKVQFSPDGNILATASGGTVKLWRAATDPEALARRTILYSDDPNYQVAHQANLSAWTLATTVDPQERNPAKAIELTKKAVELAPTQGSYWNTLGVAHYRAGDWKAALETLENSMRLMPGKQESFNTFFLAMAHWQLGEKAKARESYDKAVAWMEKNAKDNPELQRFRIEAAELLGLPAPPSSLVLSPAATDRETALRQAIQLQPNESDFHHQLGLLLHKQGKFAEAESCFRDVVRGKPELASGHFELGRALQGQKKPDDAVACYKRAIELDPKDAAVHLQLGLVLEKQGKLDESLVAFRQAIELNPQDVSSYRGLALALLNLTRSNDDRLRKAAELNPSAATAYLILGSVLREKQQPDEAVACFQRAIELDPNSAESYCFVGNTLLDNYADPRKVDEAAAYLQKGIELAPKHFHLRWGLGRALHRQKKLDDAVACFRTCLELNPNDSAALWSLGLALLDQQKPDEAVIIFRKAVALYPDHSYIQFGLGRSLMELKEQPEEAIAALRRSIELDPKRADARYQLGVLLRQQNQPDEALACFRKALELNPQHAVAHGHVGSILAIQGKTDEGIALMRKAVELNPKLASSHTELAWYLATAADPKLRDPKAAVSHARTATDLQPNQPDHRRNLGVALLRDGDHKAAAEALEKYEEMINGKFHRHGFFLAMAYWQLGERDKASQAYEQAVQWMENNSPKNEELRRFRAEAAELLELEKKTD